MTIRSLAGAGALALASALVFGWGAGSALAAPAEQANASTSRSYSLSLRGNTGDYVFDSGADCNYCSLDNQPNCECLILYSGSSTYWSWNTNPYSAVRYEIEVDYLLNNTTDSGTGGSCATAIGGITVEGTFSPNVLVAETTGTICDTQNSNLTYSGSYVIVSEITTASAAGLYTDASGSGALTFGFDDEIDPTVAINKPLDSGGQLQMSGNLSLSTAAPSCSGVGGVHSDC
jgi:hypothetical protein